MCVCVLELGLNYKRNKMYVKTKYWIKN